MISNINSFGRSQYAQSFGFAPSNNYKKNNYKKRIQNQRTEKPQSPLDYKANTSSINDFQASINAVKAVENEFLKSNAINNNNVKYEYTVKGNTMQEKMYNACLGLFSGKFTYNGKPYTGYSKGTSEYGTTVYVKYQNGDMVSIFMKNPVKKFSGYTDFVNKSAKYYISAPEQKTVLTSKYTNESTLIKISTLHNNIMFNRIYNVTDGISEEGYQRILSDVNKCFDGLLDNVYYFI